MNKFFRKKKSKAAVRQSEPEPAIAALGPVLLCCLTLYAMIAINAAPATAVGDRIDFRGSMPLAGMGGIEVKAAVVQDVWGHGAQSCRLNLQSLVRAGALMRVEAVSAQQVVVQWLAPGLPPQGCPGAPALLAIAPPDYRHIVQWRQTPASQDLLR
jgi:hypothetical protein